MKNLLRFELRKLFRSKSFYVCSAITLLMAVMNVVVMKLLDVFDETLSYSVELPSIKGVLSEIVSTSSFLTVCGVFVALFACADYEQGTIKNIYARGFSRNKVYFAKFIVVLLATLIMLAILFVITAVAALLAGFDLSSSTGIISAIIEEEGGAGIAEGGAAAAEKQNIAVLLCVQTLVCIARMSLVFMLALAIKKVAVAIAGAVVGSSVISLGFLLVDAIIDKESVQLSSYWLDQMLTDATFFGAEGGRLAVIALLSLGYAALFLFIGGFVNTRHEA